MTFESDLKAWFNITLTSFQKEQFHRYFSLLIEYNKKVNLTRITEEHEVYYKHFFDSLTLTNMVGFNEIDSVCDMGAGAGFPCIPIKIIYPHLKITIVDSLQKRISFLQELCDTLKIMDVNLVHNRAEIHALNHQQTYDLVMARALGHLGLIIEMGIPMLKNNGYFLAPKGSNYKAEITQSQKAINMLGGEISNVIEFSLPYNYGQRANILITKRSHVNGYPRTFAQMSKNLL